MKKHYRVWVEERYSKEVDVYANDPTEIEEAVRDMEENGEIEWDPGEDFDEWNIKDYYEQKIDSRDLGEIRAWLRDAIIDLNDEELKKMTLFDCLEMLECMRDEGKYIPPEVTSEDLWDAVLDLKKRRRI